MPIFAKINDKGDVVDEVTISNIEKRNERRLANGKAELRPLIVIEQTFDHNTHKHVGFTYSVTDDAVVKNPVIISLSEEDLGDFRKKAKLEKRQKNLPHLEERLEILARVLEGVTKTLFMMEDKDIDPRTEVLVKAEDFKDLKQLVKKLDLI